MKTKKKSGKTLRKSGKSQGNIREFDGIKKVGTLIFTKSKLAISYTVAEKVIYYIPIQKLISPSALIVSVLNLGGVD